MHFSFRNSACLFFALTFGSVMLSQTIGLQVSAQEDPSSTFARINGYTSAAGAYYSPPLPAAKFLNSRQADLGNNQKIKTSDYIYFADAKGSDKNELKDIKYELKPWTPEEKRDVETILDRLWHIAPGLLIKAAACGKLALCRTNSLTNFAKPSVGTFYAKGPAAVTCPSGIVISDSFFETAHQFHGLAHELVHAADGTGRICFSKAWVGFINPIISKARLQMKLTNDYPTPRSQHDLAASIGCPTIYCFQNMKEALAEFAAASIEDSPATLNSTFAEQFLDRVLLPDPKELPVDSKFRQAMIECRVGNWSEAIQILEPMVAANDQLVEAHAYLAWCYARLNDWQKSIDSGSQAMKCFESLGVPWKEEEFLFVTKGLIYAYNRNGEKDKASQCIDEIIGHIPFDSFSLYYRYYIEATNGNYVQAASDLYWSCFGRAYADRFQDAAQNEDFARQCVDQELAKFPKLAQINLRHGHFLEWLGDKESDEIKKINFYKRAAADYKKAQELDDSYDKEILFDCSNISLKLRDVFQAEIFVTAAKKHPEALETDLMQMQILSIHGENTAAKKALTQIWQKHSAEIKPFLPTNARRQE